METGNHYWMGPSFRRNLVGRGLVFMAATLLGAQGIHAAQRSAAERLAFTRENPCPATGLRRGACPGWQVDHVIALVCGGQDHRSNMQWLTVADHWVKTRHDVRACRRK